MRPSTDEHSLRLRLARPEDAPAVSECVAAAYAHWVARIGRTPWPMLQDYAVVIRTSEVVVAEQDGEVAGVLVLSETPEGFLVENVAVSPSRKGRGVGKTLLVHAEHEARRRGYTSLYLYTNEKMAENIALYARVGYLEYERRQEEGFRRVFMRKVLR
jgi:ribosomal protein S18 acetylase RimI-like enzyme